MDAARRFLNNLRGQPTSKPVEPNPLEQEMARNEYSERKKIELIERLTPKFEIAKATVQQELLDSFDRLVTELDKYNIDPDGMLRGSLPIYTFSLQQYLPQIRLEALNGSSFNVEYGGSSTGRINDKTAFEQLTSVFEKAIQQILINWKNGIIDSSSEFDVEKRASLVGCAKAFCNSSKDPAIRRRIQQIINELTQAEENENTGMETV